MCISSDPPKSSTPSSIKKTNGWDLVGAPVFGSTSGNLVAVGAAGTVEFVGMGRSVGVISVDVGVGAAAVGCAPELFCGLAVAASVGRAGGIVGRGCDSEAFVYSSGMLHIAAVSIALAANKRILSSNQAMSTLHVSRKSSTDFVSNAI